MSLDNEIVVFSPSGRESVQTKGRRLLAEGRVEIVTRLPELALARVKGSEQVHTVRWERGRGWSCDCEAGARRCSHRVAVALVIIPESQGGAH
jgi:uncharacterized Zn finger protein